MTTSVFLRPSPVAGRSEVALPPLPAYLKLPLGKISHASRSENPHRISATRRSGAKAAGLAYQRKVEAWLGGLVPRGGLGGVECTPWFRYLDDSRKYRFCSPDVIVGSRGGGSLGVVEIKLRWTSDAWWQLRRLYLPVLRVAHPNKELFPLVICRSYDPSVRIPEEVNLCDHPADAKLDAFNVLVWKS